MSEDLSRFQATSDPAETTSRSPTDLTLCICGASHAQRTCDHDFKGWREFRDGNGGEQVCTKCGMGAMAHSLSLDW